MLCEIVFDFSLSVSFNVPNYPSKSKRKKYIYSLKCELIYGWLFFTLFWIFHWVRAVVVCECEAIIFYFAVGHFSDLCMCRMCMSYVCVYVGNWNAEKLFECRMSLSRWTFDRKSNKRSKQTHASMQRVYTLWLARAEQKINVDLFFFRCHFLSELLYYNCLIFDSVEFTM